MKEKAKNDFTVGPMWKAIVRMAVPLMVAQIVNVLYSMVDRVYIGHIPGVGSLALTGLGLTMPVVSIVTAFAGLSGSGGGPLCSIARGEGNREKAEKIMGNSLTLLLVFAAALTLLLKLFAEPLLYTFGASDDTCPYAMEYLDIYIWGTVFSVIGLGMNYFINAQGFARVGMISVVSGAVLNIVLDPILIFGFDMGIKGAAIATVISQALTAAITMGFLLSPRAILDLRLKNLLPDLQLMLRIMALGVTGFVMSITNALVQIVCNTQLQRFGGDAYVGAMTIVSSIREMVMLAALGLSHGAQPVLGYNYGAGAYARLKEGIRFLTGSVLIYGACIFAVMMAIPGLLARIFTTDPALLAVAVPALRMYFCCFFLMPLQMTGQSVFVSLGMSRHAVFFSLLRKAIIVAPLAWFLPYIPTLGANGVFWSEPISDILGCLTCFTTMYFTVYRKLPNEDRIK